MEMGGLNQVDSPSGHTNEELHHFQRDRERHSLQLRQARARGGTFSELGGVSVFSTWRLSVPGRSEQMGLGPAVFYHEKGKYTHRQL